MKYNKSVAVGKKAVGYTWVPKAGSWQVYQHFNSGGTDKIEWFNTEEEAKERVVELAQGEAAKGEGQVRK